MVRYSLATQIAEEYKIGYDFAKSTVDLAYKHSQPSFPTPIDILAVVAVESSFNKDAGHRIGPSIGLMQINRSAHKDNASFDPEKNIAFGAKLLADYRKNTRSTSQALVAYNAGPGNVKRVCKGQKQCSSPYVKKVMLAKAKLINQPTKKA